MDDGFWANYRIAEAIPPRVKTTEITEPYGTTPPLVIESNHAGGNLSTGAVGDGPHFVWIHPKDDSLICITLTLSEAERLAELLNKYIDDWHRRVAAYRASTEKT